MKKVLAIIGAAAAGFAAGILTAPKSGKETRKDLKKKAVKLKADTEKVAGKAAAVAKGSVDSLKVGSRKVGDAVTETAKDVKGNVEKRFK
jgi:hypothetical protein cdivTM_02191